MDDSKATPEDPFADLSPPEWDEPSDREELVPTPLTPPTPPMVTADTVSAPILPPPVGGPDETEWSVQGHVRPELAPLVSAAAAAPPAAPSPILSAEPPAPELEVEAAPDTPDTEPLLDIPPEFWGEQPLEEPADEPIIDLSTRDTAGLITNIAGPLLWAVGLGAAWYFLTRGADPVIAARNWPTPEDTWDSLRDLAESDGARTTVRETVQRLLAGLGAGGAIGLVIGSITGRRRLVRNLVRPFTGMFRIVSPFVLLFLIFNWGGDGWWVGWAPTAVGVAAFTTWSTDRALSTSPFRVPTVSGPEVMRGLRGALVLAWTLVFAAEQALGLDGIFTAMAASAGSMPEIVAWLAIAAVLAVLVDAALRLVEHLLAHG